MTPILKVQRLRVSEFKDFPGSNQLTGCEVKISPQVCSIPKALEFCNSKTFPSKPLDESQRCCHRAAKSSELSLRYVPSRRAGQLAAQSDLKEPWVISQ